MTACGAAAADAFRHAVPAPRPQPYRLAKPGLEQVQKGKAKPAAFQKSAAGCFLYNRRAYAAAFACASATRLSASACACATRSSASACACATRSSASARACSAAASASSKRACHSASSASSSASRAALLCSLCQPASSSASYNIPRHPHRCVPSRTGPAAPPSYPPDRIPPRPGCTTVFLYPGFPAYTG